jgi:hypothetical protein
MFESSAVSDGCHTGGTDEGGAYGTWSDSTDGRVGARGASGNARARGGDHQRDLAAARLPATA